jgi:hypothetical protein
MGVLIATGFTAVAVLGAGAVAAVVTVQHGVAAVLRNVSQLPIAAVTVIGSYYVAGVFGGTAYYLLQSHTASYLGQILLAFVIGTIAYGTIGLSGTLAYVYFGLNMFDSQSPADAWRMLPRATLALATLSALLGPLIWRSQDR